MLKTFSLLCFLFRPSTPAYCAEREGSESYCVTLFTGTSSGPLRIQTILTVEHSRIRCVLTGIENRGPTSLEGTEERYR